MPMEDAGQTVCIDIQMLPDGERGGLEPRTPEWEVGGLILTRDAVLCPWARLLKNTDKTHKAVAPSRHDWKLFTRALSKNETKQTKVFLFCTFTLRVHKISYAVFLYLWYHSMFTSQ